MSDIPEALRDVLAGRYQIEEIVGRGGMATVYRARDVKHGRSVAVKVLRPDLAQQIGSSRFLNEIEIAARLNHPHILPLHDSGEIGGVLFYVMPFVSGESLRALIARVGLMDTAGALDITRRVADALDYAHRQGVVHRDIKPENILLPDGHAVVTDFGIAKALSDATGGLTRTGIALGTPGYMSPEQAAGASDIDARTDVYSLAVVTYEMLTGDLPRVYLTEESQRAGRFLDAPIDHRIKLDLHPPGIERALVRALALRRQDRFATPGDFAAAVESPDVSRFVATASTQPRPAPPPAEYRPRGEVIERVTTPPTTPGFLGAPTMIYAERVVEGEVPETEYDALAAEARATFEREGYVSLTERTLIWTARKPKEAKFDMGAVMQRGMQGDAPHVLVRVVSRGGRTRIRVEQRLGEYAGGTFGGIIGGGSVPAVILASALGLKFFSGAEIAVVPLAAGALAGLYVLARSIYRSIISSKRAAIEALADRLAEHCEGTAE